MTITFYRPSGGHYPFTHDSPAFARLEDAVSWCRSYDYEDEDEPKDRKVTRVLIPDLAPEGPTEIEETIVWHLDARTGVEMDEAAFEARWQAHGDRIILDYGPEWSAERGLPYPPDGFR